MRWRSSDRPEDPARTSAKGVLGPVRMADHLDEEFGEVVYSLGVLGVVGFAALAVNLGWFGL